MRDHAHDLAEELLAELGAQTGRSSWTEIFQLRRIIEPQLAMLAARHADDQDVELLRLLAEEQEHEENSDASTILDARFHLALAKASHNALLVRMVARIIDLLSRGRREFLRVPAFRAQAAASHRSIAEAVAAKDPQAAEAAMHTHLDVIELVVTGGSGA